VRPRLYRQLGELLLRYWDAVSSLIPVPGIGLVRVPLLLAFWNWYRRAELTSDRAGLLCLQNAEAAQTALGKLAGKINGFEDEFSAESAIAQCHAHSEVNKLVMVVAILNNAQNSHPFVPVRLKQIREYSESVEYQAVLRGEYTRDPRGLHEGGMRLQCACGAKVNVKLNFCPECGRPNDPGQQQPVALAAEAPPVCSGCGRFLSPDAAFCPSCGVKNEAAQRASPVSPFDKLKGAAAGFLKRP